MQSSHSKDSKLNIKPTANLNHQKTSNCVLLNDIDDTASK